MKLSLAIDGYEANTSSRVGIGEYAYEIVYGMHHMLSQKQQHETVCTVILPEQPHEGMPKETDWWKYSVEHPRKFWTFFALPKRLWQMKPQPNVIFSPTHYVPRFIPTPRVLSVMDLSFLHYPEMFRRKDYYQLVNWTKYSMTHAKAVFTISKFTKNAILEAYGFPKEKVFVTYPGLSPRKYMQDTALQVPETYGLHAPYILSVGTVQPRKNYTRLIEAYAHVIQENSFQAYDLVIVGKKGWLYEEIYRTPERLHIADKVKFLDFVPDEHLPALYAHADCFVLPSLYEGFGLPVLEAMAHGCQVVISNTSSLPEIAGDAGIYVDPENTESISDGIRSAVKEKSTEKGRTRIKIGKERIKLFSWEKAAAQTLDILEKVGRGEL